METKKVGILGCGLMGPGIAQIAATGGGHGIAMVVESFSS